MHARLMWKAVGDAGWEARIDHCVALAEHFESSLQDPKWRGAFKLVVPRSCTNVCFWWVPPALRPLRDAGDLDERRLEALGRAAPAIKALMQSGGDAMIGFQPLGPRRPNFFRIVFANAWSTKAEDLDALLGRIDAYGMRAAAHLGAAADGAAAAAANGAAAAANGAAGNGAAAAGEKQGEAAANGAAAAQGGRRVSKSSAEGAADGVAAV